ncbi:MAG: tetratricopeptide repeat protein [Bryobacteraceae bacterium]
MTHAVHLICVFVGGTALLAAPPSERLLDQARASYHRGDLPGALSHLLRQLRQTPRDAAVHQLLAVIFVQLGDRKSAAHHLTRSIEIEPRNAAFHFNFGKFLYDKSQFAGAVRQLQQACLLDPGNPDYRLSLAGALEADGARDAAIAELNRILAAQPNSLGAILQRTSLQLDSGDLDSAVRDLDRARKLGPGSPDVFFLGGKLAERRGQDAAAVDAYSSCLKGQPENAAAHYRLSLLLRRTGREGEAGTHAARYRELRNQEQLRQALDLARDADQYGNLAVAEAQVGLALQADPSHREALYLRGVLFQKRGQWAEASETFERLLTAHPNHPAAHAGLGVSLVQLGAAPKGRTHLLRAVTLGARDFDANCAAGIGFLLLQDFAQAEAALRKAIALWPAHPVAAARLFELYVDWNKPDLARTHAAFAEEANLDDPDLLYLLGLFWAGENRLARAERILTRAVALAPGDPKIRDLLAKLRTPRLSR